MTILVICEFGDGTQKPIGGDFFTVEDAILFALDQANKLGSATGDSHGPPERLHVYSGDKIELTIKVFKGGLVPTRVH